MATKDDVIIQRIDDLKDSTDKRLDSIDDNLKEHMRRTDILEQLHRDNQTRIELLEGPAKALTYIRKAATWLVSIGAAITLIIKYFGGK